MFQQTMKSTDVVKMEHEAVKALRLVLAELPSIEDLSIAPAFEADAAIDILVQLKAFGQEHKLVAKLTSNGQPRHVRSALLSLRDHVQRQPAPVTPILVAPYLSTQAQDLCRQLGASYLDLQGNARLAFGSFFISRQLATKPVTARRELRSLFKPKSAQVLKVLLRAPSRAWRVTDLAEASGVSLGHVSNVRTSLLDREWALLAQEGMQLCAPDALLNAWRDAYEPPAGLRQGFYTPLHTTSLDTALKTALLKKVGRFALASFSAAQWLAPFGRTGTHYFYADTEGLERLRETLELAPTGKGENVVVTVLEEPSVFLDTVQPAPGVNCTSPVQTYLDLAAASERGREAAEYLRQERLQWQG